MNRQLFRTSVCTLLALGAAALPAALPVRAQSIEASAPVYASPLPSINRPRKVILSLSERDPARVNEVLGNLGNIQRYYGADNVEIALVVYGPGIHAVLKSDSAAKGRIAGLVAIGIEILACNATLETLHLPPSALLPGVKVVPNGIPTIIERQVDGWYYVHP